MQPRVLLVDDEADFRSACKTYLKDKSFEVAVAGDSATALARFDQFKPDVVILDVDLNGSLLNSGLEVCREIRRRSGHTKIIMISGKWVQELDRLVALEAGAIVYLIKPIEPRTLVAQIKALLRLSDLDAPTTGRFYMCGQLRIDIKGYVVERWTDDPVPSLQSIQLGRKGFEILKYLVLHVNEVVSRDDLYQHVWDYPEDPNDVSANNMIDQAIHNLRQKIEADPRNPQYIRAVPGVGYKLVCPLD